MRAAALVLCLLAAPSLAQDQIAYDGGLLGDCLSQAGSTTDPALARSQCIGVASDACMQAPAGGTTAGMVQCLMAEVDDWDRLLNQSYKTAMTNAKAADQELAQLGSAAAPAAPILQQAQRHWIAFRDASCSYESIKFQGGTAGGPAAGDCMMRLTATQALRLQDIARGME